MSVAEMGAVWASGLPQNLKSVATALADYADDDGWCWPSIDRLAQKTGYSRRQTQRILHELEAIGYVVVHEPATARRSPTYRLVRERLPLVERTVQHPPRRDERREFPEPAAVPPTPPNGGEDVNGWGDIVTPLEVTYAPQGVTNATPRGDTMTPESSENPQRTVSEPPFALEAQREPPSPTPTEPTSLTPRQARPRDPIWDTLVEILGEPSPAKTRLWGERTKWIRAQPDGTPEKVRHVASRIAAEWGTRAVTVNSVVDHWTRWDAEVGQVGPGDVARAEREARYARIRAAAAGGDQ